MTNMRINVLTYLTIVFVICQPAKGFAWIVILFNLNSSYGR